MMNSHAALLLEQFDELITTPEDVDQLDRAILDLAVRGKLVAQDERDEPAEELIKKIRLARDLDSPLPPIQESEKLFALPQGWQWARVPEISYNWGQRKPDKLFTYIDVSSIENQTGKVGDELQIVEPENASSRARKIAKKGSVIYSTVRPYLLNIAILEREFDPPPVVSTAFYVMHPDDGIEAAFLFYYLRSQLFTDLVTTQATGIAYPAISDSKFSLGVIPVPPTNEQKRIIASVTELFRQTHLLREKLSKGQTELARLNEAALARLMAAETPEEFSEQWAFVANHFDVLLTEPEHVAPLRQAILELAVRGKLTRREEGDEPASQLLERIRAEKEKLVEEGKIRESEALPAIKDEEKPFELPEGWEWVRFGTVALIATNSVRPEDYPTLPHIAPDNIQKGTGRLLGYKSVMEDEVKSVNHHFFPGQLLYSKIRPNLSKATIVDFEGLCSADMYPLKPLINTEFLLRFILSRPFLNMVVGKDTRVAMPKINQNELNKVLIAIPPLNEQQRIVVRVEKLMKLCDELEAKLTKAREEREQLTAAVLAGVGGA